MDKKEIGEILRSLRKKANKSRKEVAEILNRSEKVVGHWETGYAQPDANTLFLLCKIYDADLNEAFGFGSSKGDLSNNYSSYSDSQQEKKDPTENGIPEDVFNLLKSLSQEDLDIVLSFAKMMRQKEIERGQ